MIQSEIIDTSFSLLLDLETLVFSALERPTPRHLITVLELPMARPLASHPQARKMVQLHTTVQGRVAKGRFRCNPLSKPFLFYLATGVKHEVLDSCLKVR